MCFITTREINAYDQGTITVFCERKGLQNNRTAFDHSCSDYYKNGVKRNDFACDLFAFIFPNTSVKDVTFVL
jgi:hypothetical protein